MLRARPPSRGAGASLRDRAGVAPNINDGEGDCSWGAGTTACGHMNIIRDRAKAEYIAGRLRFSVTEVPQVPDWW